MTILESLGTTISGALAPLLGAGSLIRRARFFHPTGTVFRATVTPVVTATAAPAAAERLAGPALVRCSSGWSKGPDRPDVLGLAIRFRASREITAEAAPDDQDLLMGTFSKIWLLPIAPLRTQWRDYLANDYHAAAPFDVDGLGRVELRLVHPSPVPAFVEPVGASDRASRLAAAAAAGTAVFRLEARRSGTTGWLPLVDVRLDAAVDIDQDALRFTPFRVGRGIRPRGFIHALRRHAYPWSQAARSLVTTGRPAAVRIATVTARPASRGSNGAGAPTVRPS